MYLFRFGWVLGCVSNGILGGFTSHPGTIFVVERVNRNASAGVDAPTCAWPIIICPTAHIVIRDSAELCRRQMHPFAGDAVQGHPYALRQESFLDRIRQRLLAIQKRR